MSDLDIMIDSFILDDDKHLKLLSDNYPYFKPSLGSKITIWDYLHEKGNFIWLA